MSLRTIWTSLCIAVLLSGCSGSVDQPDQPDNPAETWGKVDPTLAEQFQTALDNARAEQGLPGLAMAVAYLDTQQLWVSATGQSDLANQTAWLATDESRIGSVTKTYTAALVLRLAEEGLLSLDDPIDAWVPGWYAGPTLTHLLQHTSGIVSYNYIGSFDESASWSPADLVDWAYDHEPDLRFTPGSQWEYSNTNYVLLGLVIEAVTGVNYRQALDTWLFEPANLERPRLALTGDDSASLVRCYEGTPPVDSSDAVDPSFGWAAGGIVSTPSDLVKWTAALYGGDLLQASTLELMTTPNGLNTPGQENYGLGTIIMDDGEFALHGHTGGIGGYITSAFYLKELRVALIVEANWREADINAASVHGWATVLGVPYP